MLFYILFLVFILFLFFPLKIRLELSDDELKIYLFNINFVNQKTLQALKEIQEVTKENIDNNLMTKEDIIYLNILKKFKVLKLNINFKGINIDYEYLSIIYGLLYSVLAANESYFNNKKISYHFNLGFEKNTSFLIEGIFKTNLGKILLEYFRLRRIKYGRTSN